MNSFFEQVVKDYMEYTNADSIDAVIVDFNQYGITDFIEKNPLPLISHDKKWRNEILHRGLSKRKAKGITSVQ